MLFDFVNLKNYNVLKPFVGCALLAMVIMQSNSTNAVCAEKQTVSECWENTNELTCNRSIKNSPTTGVQECVWGNRGSTKEAHFLRCLDGAVITAEVRAAVARRPCPGRRTRAECNEHRQMCYWE